MKKSIMAGAVLAVVVGGGYFAQQQANDEAAKKVKRYIRDNNIDFFHYKNVNYGLLSGDITINGIRAEVNGIDYSADSLKFFDINYDDNYLYEAGFELKGFVNPVVEMLKKSVGKSENAQYGDFLPVSSGSPELLYIPIDQMAVVIALLGDEGKENLIMKYEFDPDDGEIKFSMDAEVEEQSQLSMSVTLSGIDERDIDEIGRYMKDLHDNNGKSLDLMRMQYRLQQLSSNFRSRPELANLKIELEDKGIINALSRFSAQRNYELPGVDADDYLADKFREQTVKYLDEKRLDGPDEEYLEELSDKLGDFLEGGRTLSIVTDFEEPLGMTRIDSITRKIKSASDVELYFPHKISVN